MNHDRPSTSAMYKPDCPLIDQDKIVFAFEREYFSNFGQGEPQKAPLGTKNVTTLFNPFQNGLQLRDQELVDFLNERLGDHEETWAGKNVAAFLSREMIEELETCFQGLEPIAKLKIVLGFSQLSTKRLHDWKREINTLLDIAAQDPDDWVEAISDNLRIFSPTGIVELEPTRNLEVYREALGRVYHKLLEFADREDTQFCQVPEVYHFCDEKVILNELYYTPREPEVHFSVKKKLKADQLREEILADLKEPKPIEDKNSGLITSLPMKFRSTLRKPDLKTPMRGIVQPNAMKLNGGFTSEPKKFPRQLSKRDGGSLLISIDDIPHAHLKRKRELEKEEKDKKKEQEHAEKKRVEAEKRKANIEKADQRRKDAEKMREDAMRRKKEADTARQKSESIQKPAAADLTRVFTDPSLELERLRHQLPVETKRREGEEPMDTARDWMYTHEEGSQSKIGDTKEDDYEYLNRPRPAGLESRETIIQNTTTEILDGVTCATIEQQRQIVAFMSGNKFTYRPLLGNTNVFKIADSIQQGIVDNGVCRVRVESFIHMNFDTGEWRKQQRCKVLAEEETPSEFDGRQCSRLTQQQIYNEIARNICDEPEDRRFAGESVIVQAYVPANPKVEVKLSEEKNKLLSPTGSATNDVLYGQEVTAGEMMTVQTGIAGCVGMRTVVGKANLAAASAPSSSLAALLKQPTLRASQHKNVETKQETPVLRDQPIAVHMTMDSSQLQQGQSQLGGQIQNSLLLQQGVPQQNLHHRMLVQRPQRIIVQQQQSQVLHEQHVVMRQQQHQQQRLFMQQQPMMNMQGPSTIQQLSIPQFAQQSVAQSASTQNTLQSSFFGNHPLPNGTQMFVVNSNIPNFGLVSQPQINNPAMYAVSQQSSQIQLQNVSYHFPNAPNQDQQYRY